MPLAFLDNFTDLAKYAEWIGAAFGFLGWGLAHPSTACWAIGAVLIFAVLRKGFPFSNVPDIGTFLGKALAGTGLLLIVLGFTWRAADQIFSGASMPSVKHSQQAHPTPEQRGVQSQDVPTPQRQEGYSPDGG